MVPIFNGHGYTFAWMLGIKTLKIYEGQTNDILIAFIVYVNDLKNCNISNLIFKHPTIDFSALFNLLGNSTCNSPEVVLAFLLYEASPIHNARDQFVSCDYFFFVDFAFHPTSQTISNLNAPILISCISTPIENWTHLYELIYSSESILASPKIFIIPTETPCITPQRTSILKPYAITHY